MQYCRKLKFEGVEMFAKVNSMGVFGMEVFPVTVEADISSGLPRFDVVGLPDSAVSESRDRVRSAMRNVGYVFPVSRITVNLAPADRRKEGPTYDLAIFVALMEASGQLQADSSDYAFLGELSLDGTVRRVNGVLPMTIGAKQSGVIGIFVPMENAREASVVEGIKVYPVSDVLSVVHHLLGTKKIEPFVPDSDKEESPFGYMPDFADVKGQSEAKRALEVAAAGGHNTLMIGSPGTGKSMLAKRIPSILPSMTFEESLETTKIYSIAGALAKDTRLIAQRPFRSPHHTVSTVGLAGGGAVPKPGELSLAHNGVLFLDELPEFPRQAMEIMRQPLEDGVITISRAAGSFTYPCSVMLVCAMNPCPCGYYGHPTRACTCREGAVSKYLSKVSGPLLDRIDIHIEVPPVDFEKLSDNRKSESSAEIRKRVEAARKIQQERLRGTAANSNAQMNSAMTREFCQATDDAMKLLNTAFDKLGLSARAYDKILRVARTIADLGGAERIEANHIAEAIQYRSLDRKFWGR